MVESYETYLRENFPEKYARIRKLSQISGMSFSEIVDADGDLRRDSKRRIKEKDPSSVTPSDLEDIIARTSGGEGTLREINLLDCDDDEKIELLRGYISGRHSREYISSVWQAYQQSDVVPGVNAGVVEVQSSESSMGYDDVITPELRSVARLLYGKEIKRGQAKRNLERLYADEIRRCVIRTINSKGVSDAKKAVSAIERRLAAWIKKL